MLLLLEENALAMEDEVGDVVGSLVDRAGGKGIRQWFRRSGELGWKRF